MAEAREREFQLAPGARIGILGGGQLARMLSVAASRLGFQTAIYSDAPESPAFDVSARHVIGAYDDLGALDRFAKFTDVLTYEFENVPVIAAEHLAQHIEVRPGSRVLEIAQDRLTEKTYLMDLGLPVAPFANVSSEDDLRAGLQAIDGPGILKTRRLGYDGKGQINVQPGCDVQAAFNTVARRPCVLEQRIAFEGELSVILVRSAAGEMRAYDCPINEHEGGILRRSTVPSPFDAETCAAAVAMAETIAADLNYVGVLAVEFFYLGRAAAVPLLINEIAPRVHNSGHWTMDGTPCDQFENHIRAVVGWPLGATGRQADVQMINLIGDDAGPWPTFAAEDGLRLHLYGKHEARPGRKMGHLNRVTRR